MDEMNMKIKQQNIEMSLSDVLSKIDVLSKKPKEFYRNMLSDEILFNSIVRLFKSFRHKIEVAILFAADSGVTKKDINSIIKKLKDEYDSKLLQRKNDSTDESTVVIIKKIIPGAPVDDKAVLPASYYFNEKLEISRTQDDYNSRQIISVCPILIVEILRNPNENSECVKLAWNANKCWRSVIVERKTIAKKSAIVDLSNNGLPITSSNAENIVNYLFEY